MSALLDIDKLCAGYGASQVLFEVSLRLEAGEVCALLGRNGMGKSTFVKCLTGWLKPSAGRIVFAGEEIASAASHRIGQLGLGLVPEGRQVFPTLSVTENLIATASTRNGQTWTLARIYELFPRLAERQKQLAGTLSGGEQQMLAIGRALMTNPRLLVLDEATEGLAPLVRRDIWRALGALKREGLAMLVIDKDLTALTQLADRHIALEKGRVVFAGDREALKAEEARVRTLVGL